MKKEESENAAGNRVLEFDLSIIRVRPVHVHDMCYYQQ